MTDIFKFSQDYELIPPQKQRSYPISLSEWNLIKKKVKEVNEGSNIWYTLGSLLLGASLSTFTTALINDFKTEKLLWTCWAVFVITLITGILSLYFGNSQKQIQDKHKGEVLDFMNSIEDRFNYINTNTDNVSSSKAANAITDNKIDIPSRINELKLLITQSVFCPQVSNQWIYKNNCLVHDYIILGKHKISIDTYCNLSGWKIQLFGRDTESYKYLLDEMCNSGGILPKLLNDYEIVNSRILYQKFSLETDLQIISVTLKDLLYRIETFIRKTK